MNSKIKILPEKLCNQIAAGEVVERPASVVKELVENSLDAGADEIVIEIDRGGKKKIVVTDNGCGMGHDDLFLCFERHATSKIKTEDDLFHLVYHGFRGEALPSIAAVSRLSVISRSEDNDCGLKIDIVGGQVKHTAEVGVPCGTIFEVKDLFFNLPARRKFLRKDETEFGHISEIVTRLALAHPSVYFKLFHNGRCVLDLFRQKCSLDRVAMVVGRTIVDELLPVDCDQGLLKLSGFVARPTVNRSTTATIYSFVNGRFVKDRVLHHAIMEGYRQLLMKGRYPVCVLFLQLDSEMVDVNVHPTKHEVRFHDQRSVHQFVSQSVRSVLRDSSRELPSIASMPFVSSTLNIENIEHESVRIKHSSVIPMLGGQSASHNNYISEPTVEYGAAPHQAQPLSDVDQQSPPLLVDDKGYFESLTIIGQYHMSYILCEDGDDLVLIDQHAAHERIGYERFKKQYASGEIVAQELLFPEILELSIREDTELREQNNQMKRLGFELEHFGGLSWALKSVPVFLVENDVKSMVCDVLAELNTVGNSALTHDAFDAVLIKMACHGMIRANQRLEVVEIKALLQQLDDVDFNQHCPHGRPILQRLRLNEVEKMFRRI